MRIDLIAAVRLPSTSYLCVFNIVYILLKLDV
jgi:hypothetical protein